MQMVKIERKSFLWKVKLGHVVQNIFIYSIWYIFLLRFTRIIYVKH